MILLFVLLNFFFKVYANVYHNSLDSIRTQSTTKNLSHNDKNKKQ